MTNQPTHKAKTIDGKWIEGWYDGSNGDQIMWMTIPPNGCPYIINPTTLCRSTYRPDSNGKMMYEGDEVEVNGRLFTIEWSEEYAAFRLSSGEYFHEIEFEITLTGKNKHD